MLTQTKPGELFIMRNAGNIVPPYGPASSGEAATIEYAVGVLGVEDIIVCGHSHCGAMNALLHPEQVESTSRRAAIGSATPRPPRGSSAKTTDDIPSGQARLTATVEENVLVQLENLRTHPTRARRDGPQALKLHGWVYKFETGQVFAYDAEHGQFESVGHPNLQAHALTAELRAI